MAQQYVTRTTRWTPTEVVSPRNNLPGPAQTNQFLLNSGEKIIQQGGRLVLLDEQGTLLSSEEFARFLGRQEESQCPVLGFVIGGSEGLPAELKQIDASRRTVISLSRMTFPHEVAFLLLAEQIYRARCILAKHPYHRSETSPFIARKA